MITSIIQEFRALLRQEEKAQEDKFLANNISLKELKNQGLAIHPLKIRRKTYEYNDKPTLQVTFPFPSDAISGFFNSGSPVTIFNSETYETSNGQLLYFSEKEAEIVLFSEDFPDWIEEKNIGLKRLPDSRSFQQMHGVLKRLEKAENKNTHRLFEIIHGIRQQNETFTKEKISITEMLNSLQYQAVEKGIAEIPVQIIHGPPGTGKTTTLTALIQEFRQQEKSIIASAPSNAAVDFLAQKLIEKGLKVLRLGNTTKINQQVWQFTPEGILSQEKYKQSLKKLRIQAEEYRKMANQYKRNFGKSEREQRKLLFQEVRAIRAEIKSLTDYYLSQYLEDVDVILGTPVGLTDEIIANKNFDVAILDEAGQCIAPLAWLVFEKAERMILAGDYFQLPPTLISETVAKSPLSISVLEQAVKSGISRTLLELQYRMTPEIANFSSQYFYDGKLQSVAKSSPDSLIFYDTAGAGFNEKREENGTQISNPEELKIIVENVENWILNKEDVVFISPYAGQVELAKEMLPEIKVSTIDSFQGQEAEIIIVSLVRSNNEKNIGFLSDIRRMNVALTRARIKMIVIGDSTTLASHPFYRKFVEYTEKMEAYRSVFELMY